jgi:hypothetical protein
MRFPIPEHWNVKQVQIVDISCTTPGCPVTEKQIRELMQL